MKRLAILAAVALAACGNHPAAEPQFNTVTVYKNTPVPCDPKLPPAPTYPDTPEAILAAPNIAEVAKLVKAGSLMRQARLAQVEAAVKACATLPPVTP